MASAVATPLERQFGHIAGVTEMTSHAATSARPSITLQFDLNRNIDAAARDVQAAINAARGQLPANLPSNPTYRKVNPADAPIMILSLTSATPTPRRRCTTSAVVDPAQKLSQMQRRRAGDRRRRRAAGGARRGEPDAAEQPWAWAGRRAHRAGRRQRQPAQGAFRRATNAPVSIAATDQLFKADAVRAADRRLSQRRGRCASADVATVTDSVEDVRTAVISRRQACDRR